MGSQNPEQGASRHPFELTPEELDLHLESAIDITFADLQSQFLVLPKGKGFVEYHEFEEAYQTLKRCTSAFSRFDEASILEAFRTDGLTLIVLRTILGLSPPEWADLAHSELDSDISQGAARSLDGAVRRDRAYLSHLKVGSVSYRRVKDLALIAIKYLSQDAPPATEHTITRLSKFDTQGGLATIRTAASVNVPYGMVLYERYLGRPFASLRDAVSELVGDVMENAVEDKLAKSNVSFHKTKRAERIPGFSQAPDFMCPDEFSPVAIIEAKITQDDGTARDKVSRILRLAADRDEKVRNGGRAYEVIACIDGRGFKIRRSDMRDLVKATGGKVFTLRTIDRIVDSTAVRRLASQTHT